MSNDNGATWDYLFLWAGDAYNFAFQQKTLVYINPSISLAATASPLVELISPCSCDVGDDGYVYCLSTVFNRDVVSDLLLHRIPIGSIEDANAWEPWGYKDGAWNWGNAPTTVGRSRRWGEISWRNLGNNRWVFTWLNMEPLGIHYMLLNGPTDNIFTAPEQALIFPAPNLETEHDNFVASPYGGFIFPGSTLDKFDFAVSQWNGDTYRVMQFRANGL